MKGPLPTARSLGLLACHSCGQLSRPAAVPGQPHCPRCRAPLHPRSPRSLSRSWAFLLAAMLLYLPANQLPIMQVTSLLGTREDTILSGVIYLLMHGSWPLALIVFFASVLIPLMKIMVLFYLLVSVQHPRPRPARERLRLYRAIDFVGRWSMVDVFVVTVLVALVQLGRLANVEAGDGALYFAAVVILTMLAASSFDPRLLWDQGQRRG
jgi:paraquat-inducible protein A